MWASLIYRDFLLFPPRLKKKRNFVFAFGKIWEVVSQWNESAAMNWEIFALRAVVQSCYLTRTWIGVSSFDVAQVTRSAVCCYYHLVELFSPSLMTSFHLEFGDTNKRLSYPVNQKYYSSCHRHAPSVRVTSLNFPILDNNWLEFQNRWVSSDVYRF